MKDFEAIEMAFEEIWILVMKNKIELAEIITLMKLFLQDYTVMERVNISYLNRIIFLIRRAKSEKI